MKASLEFKLKAFRGLQLLFYAGAIWMLFELLFLGLSDVWLVLDFFALLIFISLASILGLHREILKLNKWRESLE